LAFHNLISNNTSATGTTLLNTGIVINNATTFTSGRIYTSEDYRVNYIAGASTSLAASNSYVVGWIRKIGNTTFEFPLGNDDGGTNRYAAPIRFEPTAAAALTDHFTATYRRVSPNIGSAFDGLANPNVTPYDNVPPYFRNLHEAGIDHISNVEYWILERTNGSATGTVTLSYDNVRSGGAAYPADLLVCRYDKTTPIWQNKGNSSTSSGGGFTYVTSNAGAFTAFSPVTLGSTIDLNILPLSWLSFDAKRNGDDAVLKWNTQSEIRNEYFDIERSIDGFNFQSVGTQKAKMQSYEEKQYEWRDEKAALAAPLLYYRLKQVDMDGQFSYSKIRSVRFDENALNFVAFPNPFSDVVEVNFYTEKAEDVQIDITDVSGRSLRQFSFRWHAGGLSEKLDVSELPAGVYVFSLKTATEAYKQKDIHACGKFAHI
jgi:hypothetical protein